MYGFTNYVQQRVSNAFCPCLLVALLCFSVVNADNNAIKLQHNRGRLSLEFGSPENGLPLNTIFDTKAARSCIKYGLPFWSVDLEHESGKKIHLSNLMCGQAAVEMAGESTVILRWSLDTAIENAVPSSESQPAQHIQAVCSIHLDDKTTHLKLRLYNHTTSWSIRNVTFPELELTQLGKTDSDDALVFPFAAGRIVKSPLRKDFTFGGEQVNPSTDRTGRYSNPWTNMQFVAVWDDDGGIYIAAEDPFASVKYINCTHTGNNTSIPLKIDWPAADAGVAGNDFEHPGYITIEAFDGDWFDAAKIYRKWLIGNARWWPATGQEGRIDTPDWMKETAVWAITSLSPDAIGQTIRFAEFMEVPTALHLYNWHQVPFDNDYPHYFPVKDGFRKSVKKLQDAGVRVMPYINARLWDDDTEDFLSFALPAATKKENGEYYFETYGSKQKLVPMCPTTDLWHNTIKNIVMRLVGPRIGVDGVYLDQVSAMSPVLCYDPSHGHTLGGGHWWTTDGYWPMIENLQHTLAMEFPDKILTSECNAEPYIHGFDGYLNWHFQFNDMVPLFSAVYGGTVQQFGRAFPGKDGLAHRMKIGQSLVFGEQLGWINPAIIENDVKTAEFLRSAAKVRHTLVPFLAWGEMMRPPEVKGDIPEITAEWAWAAEEKMVTGSAVQKGAWKSPDGRIAVIFVNVSDDVTAFDWRCDPSLYGSGKTVTVSSLDDKEIKYTIKGRKNIKIQLAGSEIQSFIISGNPR